MTPKKRRSTSPSGPVSPAKPVLEELHTLRRVFDNVVAGYAARIHRELDEVTAAVKALEFDEEGTPRKNADAPSDQLRDLRDMLSLMRNLQVRPEKGRRKDLKKIDSTIGDLQLLIEHWSSSR